MKHLSAAFLAVLLSACGGNGDPVQTSPQALATPIAQCSGTRKASVVYAGTAAFPELAALPNACVYTSDAATAADLKTVMDRAMADSGQTLVFLVASGQGAATALAYINANPGHVSAASFWFTPYTSPNPGLVHSLIGITLNDTDAAACSKQAAAMPQYVPAVCTTWPDANFGPDERAAAITQLHLDLIH